MAISVTCPGCDKTLKAGDHLAGRKVKCPACEQVLRIPAAEEIPPPKPKPGSPAVPAGDGEFNWDALNLQDRSAVEDATRPPPVPPRPRRIRPVEENEDEDESGGTLVKPRGREGVRRSPPKPAAEVPRTRTAPEFSWRDHTYWFFALALLPLALSMLTTNAAQEEIIQIIADHPEVETKEALFQLLPHGKLASAHLAHDSLLHWGYACLAMVLFAGMLAVMFPNGKVSLLGLIVAGVVTGTVGIALLLLFQLIAAATRGVMPRGRGWGILIFLVIKFIGFSYYCATDPEYGFLLSFMGFTCGVGLCEELCKAVPIVVYLHTAKETNWQGACLIGLASGIGFGISEGITYAGDSYNGIAPLLTYFVRFLSCVSLHAIWSGTVALAMERNQDYIDVDWEWEDIAYFLLYYLAIAMVLHGLYDTLLKQDYEFLALLVALLSFGWWCWQLRRAAAA